ncbi:glycosyltransferase family 8 protein [Pararhizobium gei]|uniref:glycosyltransferase family 8 protein n=1 Tax=Pararhizobium gei TaxID=1395951 RepID=UPI0023DB490D|nr:glycosyltransferase family 8 protein [Rhizobium gei]
MLIACATDRYYVEMTGVLIRSVCAQPHSDRLRFYVFCAGVPQKDKDKLAACAFGDAEINIVDIDDVLYEQVRDLPVRKHISVVAYVSIFIPKLLEGEGDRLLYVDCDVVVNTSLDPLFALDLGNRAVGAAPDTTLPDRMKMYNEAIGHSAEAPYFNSGIFIVDIKTWNAHRVTERGAAYARSRLPPITQHDQAVLNKVLKDDWLPLDPSWNAKPTDFTPATVQTMPILHYRGRSKPFHADFPKKYRTVYDMHRMHTPWAKTRRLSKMERSLSKRRRGLMERLAAVRGALVRYFQGA